MLKPRRRLNDKIDSDITPDGTGSVQETRLKPRRPLTVTCSIWFAAMPKQKSPVRKRASKRKLEAAKIED
jgi:hypothetical protein